MQAVQQPHPAPDRKRTSFFRRRSTPPEPPPPAAAAAPATDDTKKGRFSLFRARRSGVVLDPTTLLPPSKEPPSSPSLSSSSASSSGRRSDSAETDDNTSSGATEGQPDGDPEDVSSARTRALSILEGRPRPSLPLSSAPAPSASPTPPARSTSPTISARSASPTTPSAPGRRSTTPRPLSFVPAVLSRRGSTASASPSARRLSTLSQQPPPASPSQRHSQSRSRSGSLSFVIEHLAALGGEPAPEGEPGVLDETLSGTGSGQEVADEHGLPTYASAAFPRAPVAYRFAQAGPFAMTLAARDGDSVEGAEGAGAGAGAPPLGLGRYHVSVGVNVWAPRTYVTSVRRGLDGEGPLVAQIEMGCSSATMGPSLTMGDVGRPLKDVMSKNLVNGSRIYQLGNGTSITWRLGREQWKATIASREVATFYPNPPRAMVLQPIAHKFFDHLLIGVLLLMREKDEAVYARPDYRTVELPFY